MQQNATKKKPRNWRRTKRTGQHRDIIADAKKLGVHRSSLWRMLRGEISNPELLARYTDLLKIRTKTSSPKTNPS